MDTVKETDRRISEAMAPIMAAMKSPAVTGSQPAEETAVKPAGDARGSSALHSGKSRSAVAFVATTGEMPFSAYGIADVGNLVSAIDGMQDPKGTKGKSGVAVSMPLVVMAGLGPAQLAGGIQAGLMAPVGAEMLKSGLLLAQSGGYQSLYVEAENKVQHSAVTLHQFGGKMAADERHVLTLNQDGLEVVADYASDLKDKAEDQVAGIFPGPIILIGDGPAGASAPAAPLPKREFTRKGISRETVDVIRNAVQPEAAAPGKTCTGKKTADWKNRRDLILTLASDFMATGYASGNSAKMKLFDQAMKAAATRDGIKLSDPKYKDVVAYFKKLIAQNPSLSKMIQISGDSLRIRAPKNLFSDKPRISHLIGITHMLAKGDPAQQALMGEFFTACTKGGVSLTDAKYGSIAKQALAIIRSNPGLFKEETLVEKDGKVTLSLSKDEMADLQQFFTFMGSTQHSDAAGKVLAAQNDAVKALDTSITASSSVVVALSMLHVLAEAGLAPMPAGAAGEAPPAQAGPAGSDTVRHDPPPSGHDDDEAQGPPAGGGPAPRTRTILPPSQETASHGSDSANYDLATAMRSADTALAQARSERKRGEAKREAEIRSAAEKSDRDYDAALAKQRQMLDDLAKDVEASRIAKGQTASGTPAGASPIND